MLIDRRDEMYVNEAETNAMDDSDEHMYGYARDFKHGTWRGEVQALLLGCLRFPSRAPVVCLGVLVILLLAGIIGLGFHHTNHVDINLTRERDFLQTRNTNLTKERDLLQTSYNKLTAENRQLKRLYDAETCPTGWRKFNSRCFFISNEKKTWNESRQDCVGRGADLVIINSIEEQQAVLTFNKRVWIGLTDIEVEGTWKWVDGTPLTTEYSFWDSQQPDNGAGFAYNGEEDCGEIHLEWHNPIKKWNDLNCERSNYWICEKEI